MVTDPYHSHFYPIRLPSDFVFGLPFLHEKYVILQDISNLFGIKLQQGFKSSVCSTHFCSTANLMNFYIL